MSKIDMNFAHHHMRKCDWHASLNQAFKLPLTALQFVYVCKI